MKATKKQLTILLTFVLSINLLSVPPKVQAAAQAPPDTITVCLKVEDIDSTLVSQNVTLTKDDITQINQTFTVESGNVEIPVLNSDYFTAAHAIGKYITGTSDAPKKDLTFSYGSPAYIKGQMDCSFYSYWSFRVNNASPADESTGYSYTPDTCPVKDGDTIVFFRQGCYDQNAGDFGAYTSYSWFDRDRYETTVNTPVSVTCLKDDGFGFSVSPAADETLSIYEGDSFIQEVKTGQDGSVLLTFDRAGTYTLMGGRLQSGVPVLSHTSAFITVAPAGAWSSFRNETGAGNANIIAAQTPVTPENTGTKWQLKFEKDAVTAYNSDPVITDDKIYVACKDTLYELNKNGVILRTFTLAAPINSVCHMSLHENRLFIPLSGGTLQCVDIQTMSSLWTSEAFGLQSLTSTFYKKGFLCAGTTNASGTDGLYYCLSETDGSTQWVYRGEPSCGYYWSGAVSGKDGTDYILFGGDDGVLISHSLSTDAVYDTYDLSSFTASHGKIRAGVTYDIQTDAFYTTTTDGYLYQIKMNEDGSFRSVSALPLFSDNSLTADNVNCTSTPTIYNGRIYVCSYVGTQGQINVVNAASMKMVYTATAPECHDIKSSPLVCSGYASDENNNRVYVYFTQNFLPGGIYYIEDDETAVSAQIKTLFLPAEGKQFCLSSVAADTDGTLYYSNDSGTLFAISEGYAAMPQTTPQPDSPTPIPSTSVPSAPVAPAPVAPASIPPAPTPPAPASAAPSASTAADVKPEKPGKIAFTKKKKKNNRYRVTFTWKKGKNSDFTQIKIQGKTSSKKKYKRTLNTFRKKITATLKKGTYTIRFYGCRTSSGKSSAAAGVQKSGAVTLRLRLR